MSVEPRSGGSLRARQAVDAVTYALAVTGATVAVGAVTAGGYALAVGGPVWTAVKWFLFLAGFGLLGYASLRLWPSRPADDEADIQRPVEDGPAREEADYDDSGPGLLTGLLPGAGVSGEPDPGADERERGRPVGRTETRFQRTVQALPPVRWVPLPPERRFSPRTKLLLGSLLVLATSFLMETALGVGG